MESTKEVISSLKFIGLLQKGDKINTKFMYRQPDGLFTRISRTFINSDNRQNTLNFIHKIIYSSLDVLMYYERSTKTSDKAMCINIVQDLMQAKIGLSNLKLTYSEDLKFNCDLDTILQVIESNMKDIEPKYMKLLKFQKEQKQQNEKEQNKESNYDEDEDDDNE